MEGWLGKLHDILGVLPAARDVIAEQVLRPPGTFGADEIPMARLKGPSLDTISKLAAIMGAAVTHYGATVPPPKQCEIVLRTGQAETFATYDCKSGVPAEIAEVLKLHVQKHGTPQKVKVTPVHKSPK